MRNPFICRAVLTALRPICVPPGALDTFVLTGAIKLYREQKTGKADRFKHHTMLVHQSVKQADHRELADAIRDLWRTAGYYGAGGLRRLEAVFEDDVRPVMEARADGEPIPASFADVKPYVGEVVTRIEGSANDPVLIVNGDADAAKENVDFDRRSLWRILAGGAKLSRGFTVEGLNAARHLISTTRSRPPAARRSSSAPRWSAMPRSRTASRRSRPTV